jgi:hypothetical protein
MPALRKGKRRRGGRYLRRSFIELALLLGLAGGMCGAIMVAAILIAKHVAPPLDLVTSILAIPLYIAAFMLANRWSVTIAARLIPETRPHYAVRFTDEAITSSGTDKDEETVAWAELTGVVIVNEDAFPVGWQYWLLLGAHGEGAVIPSDAEGMQELLGAMQERLPGFDNQAVVAAMGRLDGAFQVWRKPD